MIYNHVIDPENKDKNTFNRHDNSLNSSHNKQEKLKNIKNNIRNKIHEKDEILNLKESKLLLNNSVNNILPGKNYARNNQEFSQFQ